MDVVEMFVEVDSVSRVSGGGGGHEHEVRDGTCPRMLRLSCAMRRT